MAINRVSFGTEWRRFSLSNGRECDGCFAAARLLHNLARLSSRNPKAVHDAVIFASLARVRWFDTFP